MYNKAWVALAGVLVNWASMYWSGNHLLNLVIGVLTVAGVYGVKNNQVV